VYLELTCELALAFDFRISASGHAEVSRRVCLADANEPSRHLSVTGWSGCRSRLLQGLGGMVGNQAMSSHVQATVTFATGSPDSSLPGHSLPILYRLTSSFSRRSQARGVRSNCMAVDFGLAHSAKACSDEKVSPPWTNFRPSFRSSSAGARPKFSPSGSGFFS